MTEQNVTKSYKFDFIDEQIALMLIAAPELTDDEISKDLKLSRATINRRRNSEQVKSILKRNIETQKNKIDRLLSKSIAVIENELDTGLGPTKVMTALSVLKVFDSTLNQKAPADIATQEIRYIAEWGGMMKE
jgi:hypothetical protein